MVALSFWAAEDAAQQFPHSVLHFGVWLGGVGHIDEEYVKRGFQRVRKIGLAVEPVGFADARRIVTLSTAWRRRFFGTDARNCTASPR